MYSIFCSLLTMLFFSPQPAPAWTTFRVGLFCGIFIVLNITLVLAGK